MITYYTDGSASPNPGPGGFAVIRDGVPYMIGGEPNGGETTNIRMEGLAIKTALEDADGAECQIYTDSEFWINVITKWAPGWEAKGWKKKGGRRDADACGERRREGGEESPHAAPGNLGSGAEREDARRPHLGLRADGNFAARAASLP